MLTLKSLTTVIVVVASLLVLALIVVRERRFYLKKKRKKKVRRPVVQSDETVYSMFSELPDADGLEYDPIGEAEIYLAYGNKRTALDVLTKAAKEHPEREDIRRKIGEIETS